MTDDLLAKKLARLAQLYPECHGSFPAKPCRWSPWSLDHQIPHDTLLVFQAADSFWTGLYKGDSMIVGPNLPDRYLHIAPGELYYILPPL